MRLAALLALVALPVQAAPEGYRLVWSDEFDTSGLPDPAKWAYDTEANATGWYNNEQQYYAVANPDHSVQSDGVLRITARKTRLDTAPDYGGQDYASARLITKGLAAWTYGYIEASARVPCGQGLWPAIWMLGPPELPWPVTGEIDILEHINAEPGVHGTLHNQATKGTSGVGGAAFPEDICGSFHTYHLLWTESRISIGVDDKVFVTYDNPGKGQASWPYDQPFYLILNLAVGGNWPGWVDDRSLPATFEVDYVRVYQR